MTYELTGTMEANLPEVRNEELLERAANGALEYVHDPDKREEVTKSLQTAKALVKKLDLTPGFLDPENPRHHGGAVLLFSFAKKWDEAVQEGDLTTQKIIAKRLAALFDEDERAYPMIASAVHHIGLPDGLSEKLIAHFWPESNGDIDWVKKNALLEADKPIAYFPISQRDGKKLTTEIYDSMGIPEHKRVYFSGYADSLAGITVLWHDSDQKTELHELQHLRHPGVRLGMFNEGFDEGMTEYRALLEYMQGSSMNPILRGSGDYINLVRTLVEVFREHSGLEEIFHNKYEENTQEAWAKFSGNVIEHFGLDGIYILSSMRPDIYKPENVTKSNFRNDLGYISAEAATKQLGIKKQFYYSYG